MIMVEKLWQMLGDQMYYVLVNYQCYVQLVVGSMEGVNEILLQVLIYVVMYYELMIMYYYQLIVGMVDQVIYLI